MMGYAATKDTQEMMRHEHGKTLLCLDPRILLTPISRELFAT